MSAPSLPQIVRHLRMQVADIERGQHSDDGDALFLAAPVTMDRREFFRLMSPACWDEECHECSLCACACHDEQPVMLITPPPAAPAQGSRCPECSYGFGTPGHQLVCGGEAA